MRVSSRQNVLYFGIAYLLSAFGYEFILFVMTVHIYTLTHSALNVGIFTALGFFPRLFSPYYGLLADRYDKKSIFALAAGLMGISILIMSFVSSVDGIYALWFVVSVFAMMIMNVRTTIMTELMTRDNYLHGNSMVLIMLNIAKISAPFLAGLVAVLWTSRSLLHLAVGIYFAVLLFASFIPLSKKTGALNRTAQTVFSDIKDGVSYIIKDSALSYLAVVGICWRLFLGLQVSLLVVYVKSFLGHDNAAYGIFMTCIGLGSITGSWLGPKIAKKIDSTGLGLWGLGAHYLTFSLLGLIHDFYAALATAFVSYAFFYLTLVGIHSLRDRASKVDIRGRVYGSITAILTPSGLVSMLLGGYLAGVYGAGKVLTGAGILAAVSLAATRIAFSGRRRAAPEGAQ